MSGNTILDDGKLAEIEQKYKRCAGEWNGENSPSEHNAWITGLTELVVFPFKVDTPIVKIFMVNDCLSDGQSVGTVIIDRAAKLMGVYEIKYPIDEIVSMWLILPEDPADTTTAWVMLRRLTDKEYGNHELPRLVVETKQYTRDEYVAAVLTTLRQSKHVDYRPEQVATAYEGALTAMRKVVQGYADIFDIADSIYQKAVDIYPENQAGNAIHVLTRLWKERKIKLRAIGSDETSFTFRLEPQKSTTFCYKQSNAIGELWWDNRGVATTVCRLITNDAEFMEKFNEVFARRGYRLDIVADRKGDLIGWQVNLVKLLEK